MRIIVMGLAGRFPFAGMAWQVLHYLHGFRRLGHQVFYLEDSGDWPYDPERNAVTADAGYAVRYLSRLLRWARPETGWAYRAHADGDRLYGLSEARLRARLERTDVLVNLHGAAVMREEYLHVPIRIYLETDPVRPQLALARGETRTRLLLGAHTHHFSFAENLGAPECPLPLGGIDYRPTRQPVILEWWASSGQAFPADQRPLTTIANWRQQGQDEEWEGQTFGWSKHSEFMRFVDLPRRTSWPLELALASIDPETTELLRAHGWSVIDAVALSREIAPYRDYIIRSAGEFTVAKDQNIRFRTGWFSDRSACYLAAGRPVVVQDTGFGRSLPTGEGLFAFRTVEDIEEALRAIQADYARHSRAALDVAREFFRAETVLAQLLADLEG